MSGNYGDETEAEAKSRGENYKPWEFNPLSDQVAAAKRKAKNRRRTELAQQQKKRQRRMAK